jgi:tetratricopeptide (TPR) repeat protein
MTFQKHLNIILVFCISINLFGQSDSYNKHLLDGNLNYDENFVIAENSYRKAISINPDNIKGSYNLSNKYYEEELYDEALARQAQALKNAKTPNEKHSIHHNIGNILMKKGLCKEAFEAYKNALRNNSKDDETRYNLSLAKVCADEQNKNNEKKDDKKNKQDNKNNKQEEQNDKQDQNQKNDQENNDNKQENKNKASAKLSPEQIKNLLKAMNNEEKKVQAKINEKKQKGVKIITEKDW